MTKEQEAMVVKVLGAIVHHGIKAKKARRPLDPVKVREHAVLIQEAAQELVSCLDGHIGASAVIASAKAKDGPAFVPAPIEGGRR
jgi:hypothetical protein